jgi:hypothetical protein
MILEVQTGVVCRACNDSERLNPERRKGDTESTETSHCASAERTVQPSEQAEEH